MLVDRCWDTRAGNKVRLWWGRRIESYVGYTMFGTYLLCVKWLYKFRQGYDMCKKQEVYDEENRKLQAAWSQLALYTCATESTVRA